MKKRKQSTFWKYYIKGDYHCDTCPFCWGGEYMPGCDDYADCGCYIRGDIRDTCRIIPPIRFIIGWGKRKKAQYYENHHYDDYDDYIEEKESNVIKVEKAIRKYIEMYGSDIPSIEEHNYNLTCGLYNLSSELKDIFAPVRYAPLKEKWKSIIKDTWQSFIMIFKPYFCN